MYEDIEFSRRDLFHMVWAQPVLAIAKEIGISDVALSKACRKAGIPLPGRGYWASVKGGRRVSEPKLPGLKPGQADLVRFRVLQNPPNRVLWDAPQPVAPIAVPEKLQKPHRLVAELQAAAKEAREDKGVLVLNYAKVLRVRTSARCLPRSARLLDALLKQFESRGYSFRIGDRYVETEVVLNEGAIPFRLDEQTKQTPPPEPAPARRKGTPAYEPWRPAYVLKGTGNFTLEFGKYSLQGCRRTWKDRPGLPLEAQLHEVMEAIPTWEATLRHARLEREEEEARSAEAEKRRVNKARAEEVLRRQRALFVENVRSWERAERLRRFVAAVVSSTGPTEEVMTWMAWANAQIKALDPLERSLKDVLNLAVELEDYYSGPSPWEKPNKDWWG
ncbi:hypothetical protein [Dyella sp. 2YAF14]|uniref:hypothetical protein n=1 Tax=Dyella sp. 2YAF14 TaxID=3233025 RepID=UPI003F912157